MVIKKKSYAKEREGRKCKSFGDNKYAKIIGKGKVILGSQKSIAENVLLVEDLKHDLLSVS